jgi:hypothetical protein
MTNHKQAERNVTTAEINSALVGAWDAHLTFTEGPRPGERERLRWTFLPAGLIIGTDAENGQLPPAIGEWTGDGDRFAFWLNAVDSDPAGRPTSVVYGHGEGTLAADGQTLTATGGSEVYSGSGALLATNCAEVQATRIEADASPTGRDGRG